jgi:uncharacterized protein
VSPRDFALTFALVLLASTQVITWDEAKRRRTLNERGLDFADAELVFAGRTMTLPDNRRDYREERFITAGWLRDRFVVVVWTPRDGGRRIIFDEAWSCGRGSLLR